jgi:primary-amine oxidase
VTAWREYSTKAHPYGQPPITIEEVFKVGDIVKADADWRRAMKRRGLNDEDIELVQVDPFSAGYFDREVEKGRRLVSAVSYWRKDIKDNGYAHPIEGVVALVDLIENRIVHLVDEPDIVPIPKKSRNYDRASIPQTRKDVKPLDVVQKDGPSFTVDGWKVDWQNWSFRVGWTAREGLVLHQIAFRDGARERPIIYRASVTDMIVPYADPTANHFWKCAFDAGEYGLGKLANALELGCDCLGHIHYFDVPVADDYGKPTIMKNALPARGGLRDPLEALRIPQRDVRGAAVTPPRHLVLHHRRKLRLRILLVLLPGRHHSARSQAHRHHPDGGDRTGQAVSVGRHGR